MQLKVNLMGEMFIVAKIRRFLMINIELPNPSKRVFLSEYNSVQNTSGFYIMRNIKSEIIYKGESQNIRKRLGKHFRGKSD